MITIAVTILIWFVLHMLGVYLCHKLSGTHLNKMLDAFSSKPFEGRGTIYQKIFHIQKWKDFLPDGGKINRFGFEKSRLVSKNESYLNDFILETLRAELIHWFGILSSLVFLWIYAYPKNILIFSIAILVDIPFIMIQRYNRPRLQRIVKHIRRKNNVMD